MPKISIILPNYNHARFLKRRVESIFEQGLDDAELIFLDDCSGDSSREILHSYAAKHKNIRCCFNERNSGSPFAQWNRGVELATGEYIWIAESDDWARPGFLERMVGLLDRNPNAGIAYCLSLTADETGGITGDYMEEFRQYDTDLWAADFTMCGKEFIANYMSLANVIPNASAAVFRRDVYRQAGPADSSFRLSGDRLQWIKMLLLSDVSYCAEPLSVFRYHSVTARSTHVGWRQLKEKMLNLRFIVRHVDVPRNRQVIATRMLRGIWRAALRDDAQQIFSRVFWVEHCWISMGWFRAAFLFFLTWCKACVERIPMAGPVLRSGYSRIRNRRGCL